MMMMTMMMMTMMMMTITMAAMRMPCALTPEDVLCVNVLPSSYSAYDYDGFARAQVRPILFPK
jgi:hypothetical protein